MSQKNRTQFFEDTDGGYPSYSQPKVFMTVWNKVTTFEKNVGRSLDDGFTKEEYIALFNFILARCSNSFYNDKKVVLFYIRYLIVHGILPIEQENILDDITVDNLSIKESSDHIRYFKNLNHLRDAIDDTIKVASREDETRYDVPSAILYLAWYGLTEEQVLSLPKTAVLEDGIVLDGQKIEMPFFLSSLLVRLRDAEGYYTRGRGLILRKYMYSNYLIRTEDSDQITVPQMRGSLTRMNKVMDYAYSLRFDTARQSGIFYRAYMLECESVSFDLSDPKFASKVFLEDFTQIKSKTDPCRNLRDRTRDYKMYKQLFS